MRAGGPDAGPALELPVDAGRSTSATRASPPSPVDGPTHRVTTTPFEVFRLRLGRRSPEQVAALPWDTVPGPVIDELFIFGPRTDAADRVIRRPRSRRAVDLLGLGRRPARPARPAAPTSPRTPVSRRSRTACTTTRVVVDDDADRAVAEPAAPSCSILKRTAGRRSRSGRMMTERPPMPASSSHASVSLAQVVRATGQVDDVVVLRPAVRTDGQALGVGADRSGRRRRTGPSPCAAPRGGAGGGGRRRRRRRDRRPPTAGPRPSRHRPAHTSLSSRSTTTKRPRTSSSSTSATVPQRS